MPARTQSSVWNQAKGKLAKLQSLVPQLATLPPRQSKFVAEMVLLRGCGVVEESVENILLRIACGTPYMDGSAPLLVVKLSSQAKALDHVLKYSRHKKINQTKWSNVDDCVLNMNKIIDPADPFYVCMATFKGSMDEIRYVRNHAAHSTAGTRSKYRDVVKKHYGAIPNRVTPGDLLLKQNMTPLLIDQYLVEMQMYLNNLVRV